MHSGALTRLPRPQLRRPSSSRSRSIVSQLDTSSSKNRLSFLLPGAALSAFAVLPSVSVLPPLLASNVLPLPPLVAIDVLFILGASAYLLGVEHCDTVPGRRGWVPPWRSGRALPKGFGGWLAVVLITCVAAPAIILAAKLALDPLSMATRISVAVLGPYFLTLLAQLASEALLLRRGSPAWPLVPVVYQAQRVTQLLRGIAIYHLASSHGLTGVAWLPLLLQCLLLAWVVNLGAHCANLPYLYGWRGGSEQPRLLQPAGERS